MLPDRLIVSQASSNAAARISISSGPNRNDVFDHYQRHGVVRNRTNQRLSAPPIFLFGGAVGASCRVLDTISVEHNNVISAGLNQLLSLEASVTPARLTAGVPERLAELLKQLE